jgi:phage terminase small subunit
MSLEAISGGSGMPQEPDWTSIYTDDLKIAVAQLYWREIVSEMRDAGTIVVANGPAIQRLVFFRIEYDRSMVIVAEEGKIILAKRTKRPQISPQWTVLRQASEQIVILEAELGISPRRRNAAAKVQRAKKKATAADNYLRTVGK